MDTTGKKFISPFAWFSFIYPFGWHEFEEVEGTFLFYDPDKWSGNFRISAYKAEPSLPGAMKYAQDSIQEELRKNSSATTVMIGQWTCAYSVETFQEEGVFYNTHIWITGAKNLVFECTFTVPKGGDKQVAEDIIATLEVRDERKQYPLEIIPVRLMEIGIINEEYEKAMSIVKSSLKKDFTANKEDITKLQQIMESGKLNFKKRDNCYAFGIAFGVILVNEMDGMNWVTVIDNNRELSALQYKNTNYLVYPQQLIWDKVNKGLPCNLIEEFEEVVGQVVSLER